MKRGFYINQEALHSAGIRGVDYIDLAIFEFIATWASNGSSLKKIIDNRVYCFVQSGFLIKNMPFLCRKGSVTKYAIAQRVDVLVDAGLLQRHPDNQATGKTYFGLTSLADDILILQHGDLELINSTPLESINSTPLVNKLDLYNRDNSIENIKQRDRETHAQKSEKEQPPATQQKPKQPDQKNRQPLAANVSTLDIPFCEGHGVRIEASEYPRQPSGAPFVHPSLVLDRIPFEKRIDVWWALYGIDQGRIKCEGYMMRDYLATEEVFQKLYLHTFLYVAIYEKVFRKPPTYYLQNKMWRDEIIDRRKAAMLQVANNATGHVPLNHDYKPD